MALQSKPKENSANVAGDWGLGLGLGLIIRGRCCAVLCCAVLWVEGISHLEELVR